MEDERNFESGAAAELPNGPRDVLHWYDFLCPFCYVGRQRNSIFERYGFRVIDVPFEAHPDIPPAGRLVPPRSGAMYTALEAQAREAGLPLKWPSRLPNTRMALAAAEWTRRYASKSFPAFETALFAAHFAENDDLGNIDSVLRRARESGVDVVALRHALDDGSAAALVKQSEVRARSLGVHGTPAWFVAGHLVPGLYPEAEFDRLVATFSKAESSASP